MQIAAMFFPPPINAEKERSWDPSWVVVVVFANAIVCYLSPRPELEMGSMQKLLWQRALPLPRHMRGLHICHCYIVRPSISIYPSIQNIELNGTLIVICYIAIHWLPGFHGDFHYHHHPSIELPTSWRGFFFKCGSACQHAPTDWKITYDGLHVLRCHAETCGSQKFRTSCDLVSMNIPRSCQVCAPVLGHSSFLLPPKGARQVSSQVRVGLGGELMGRWGTGRWCGDLQIHISVYLCIVHACVCVSIEDAKNTQIVLSLYIYTSLIYSTSSIFFICNNPNNKFHQLFEGVVYSQTGNPPFLSMGLSLYMYIYIYHNLLLWKAFSWDCRTL